MNLEDIPLHEISRSYKDKYCTVPRTGDPRLSSSQKQRGGWWGPGSGETGRHLVTGVESQFCQLSKF